jgi:hypothetical protein
MERGFRGSVDSVDSALSATSGSTVLGGSRGAAGAVAMARGAAVAEEEATAAFELWRSIFAKFTPKHVKYCKLQRTVKGERKLLVLVNGCISLLTFFFTLYFSSFFGSSPLISHRVPFFHRPN